MRTTITLDEELLAKAQRCTGITDPSALVRDALTAPIHREAARRAIKLGGTEPDLKRVTRRRSKRA